MSESIFSGRSIAVVNDLSIDEQMYLYTKTRELKRAIENGHDITKFKVQDPNLNVYLFFLEDSTRTKESFRNAAKFHGARVNDFLFQSSSIIKKKESITDTVKMLFGYGARSMFVVRSKLEGVCRWLENAIGDYAVRMRYPRASFINAGDGKHEHPTQEFLDEFSFLEHKDWQRDSIRIALVGDLFHGRTVHSKVDGLKVFNEVHVDLIAPKELALPDHYRQMMIENGFIVREFSSIVEYLENSDVSDIWYFTRLQLERMGETVLDKADLLRQSVSFVPEYLGKLPQGTKFYHPLPRNRENPTIPTFLDDLNLNGWDGQSTNGYFTRIIEIAMMGGALGEDFAGQEKEWPDYADDFVEDAPIKSDHKPEYKVGIKPVDNGIVIDHIGSERDIESIWNQIDKIRHIMGLNSRSSHGVYHTSKADTFKGIISLPNILSFDERQIKMLGAIAPGCTLNIIKNKSVEKKYRLHIPPRIYNFDEISCKNDNCISHPDQVQQVMQEFYRSAQSTFVCKYCERPHDFEKIWDV